LLGAGIQRASEQVTPAGTNNADRAEPRYALDWYGEAAGSRERRLGRGGSKGGMGADLEGNRLIVGRPDVEANVGLGIAWPPRPARKATAFRLDKTLYPDDSWYGDGASQQRASAEVGL
jgi:hypothetical protein